MAVCFIRNFFIEMFVCVQFFKYFEPSPVWTLQCSIFVVLSFYSTMASVLLNFGGMTWTMHPLRLRFHGVLTIKSIESNKIVRQTVITKVLYEKKKKILSSLTCIVAAINALNDAYTSSFLTVLVRTPKHPR